MPSHSNQGVKGRAVIYNGSEWTVRHVFKNGKLKLQHGAYTRTVLRSEVTFVRHDYTVPA